MIEVLLRLQDLLRLGPVVIKRSLIKSLAPIRHARLKVSHLVPQLEKAHKKQGVSGRP